MKTLLISAVLFFTLSASQCKKKWKNCHYDLIIQNKSGSTIIMAYRFYYNNLCALQGTEIQSNNSYTEHSRTCWEDRLANGSTQEIFIVDPTKYNNPNAFYSCDSIEIKNTVLKHYVLSLDDLKKNNFTVTYP